jgi:hypothetical protein
MGECKGTYNLLAHATVRSNLLTLCAAELLGACVEGLVEVVITSRGTALVWVVHIGFVLGNL